MSTSALTGTLRSIANAMCSVLRGSTHPVERIERLLKSADTAGAENYVGGRLMVASLRGLATDFNQPKTH